MAASEPPSPSGRGLDGRAVVVLGVALGLLPAAGDALLLPEVAEASPRSMALAALGAGLTAGAAWTAWRGGTADRSARRLAVLVLAAGSLVAWVLPLAHLGLVSILASGSPVSGSLLVVGSTLAVSAPLTLPLGALLGLALVRSGRRGLAGLCLGTSLGLALSGWCGEVLLGHQGTLLVATVLATSAAAVFGEGGPPARTRHQLPLGAWSTHLTAAALLTLAHHLGLPWIDLGSLAQTLLPACALLGCALAALGTARRQPRPLDLLATVGLVLAFGLNPDVLPQAPSGLWADLATLAVVGLPIGWLAGRQLTGRDEAGVPLWLLPAAWTLPPMLVIVVGLELLGVLLTLILALLPLLLAGPGCAGRQAWLPAVRPLILAVLLSFVPLPVLHQGTAPAEVLHTPRGTAAVVDDPHHDRRLLALDGRAALERSPLQERRLVHLPLLLRPAAQRLLLVAEDLGGAARTSLQHDVADITWLRPFPVPWTELSSTELDRLHVAHGNERLHLARRHAPHDLVVMLPDPRVRRRAALVGTVEFFEACAANLHEGGLLCQWWDLSQLDATDLKGVIGGAVAAFEHVYLALDHPRSRRPCLAILASQRPLRVTPAAIERALDQRPAVAEDWRRVGLDGVLTACLVWQQSGVTELIAPAERMLADDRSTLGVRGGLRPLAQPESTLFATRTFTGRRCDPMPWLSVPHFERQATEERVRDVMRGWQHLLGAAQDELAARWPDTGGFEDVPGAAVSLNEGHRLAQALASLPDWPYLLAQVLEIAVGWERDGRLAEAEHLLRAAIDEMPHSPDLRYALASFQERRGQGDDACLLYRTVLAFDAQHDGARRALQRLGCEG